MDKLKEQITYMRQQMYSQGMFKELCGFNTAIKMFAASGSNGDSDKKEAGTKKTFKEKAADVWKKHKGKILAGAAIAATAAGAGYGGKKLYDSYNNNKKKKFEAAIPSNNLAIIDRHKPTVDEIVTKMKNGENIPPFWAHDFYDVYAKACDEYYKEESHS